MALIDIYNASNDATFQGRCQVAAWQLAQQVLAGTTAPPAGIDAQSAKDWANKMMRGTEVMSVQALAKQVLANPTIAANPTGATDNDIEYQMAQSLTELITAG